MERPVEGRRTRWRSATVWLLVLLLVCASAVTIRGMHIAALHWARCPGFLVIGDFLTSALLGLLGMGLMLCAWIAIRYVPRWPDFTPGAEVSWIGWFFALLFAVAPAILFTLAWTTPWDAEQAVDAELCGLTTPAVLAHASLVPYPFFALALVMAFNGPRRRAFRKWRIILPVCIAVAGWLGYVLWALIENSPGLL